MIIGSKGVVVGMKKFYFFLLLLIIFMPFSVYGNDFSNKSNQDNQVTLYFFHGDGCPHCEDEIEWLNEVTKKYSNLLIKEYEVWYNEDNDILMQKVKEQLGVTSKGVPFTVIGEKYFLGFGESTGNSMETQIRFCSKHTHSDIVKAIRDNLEDVSIGKELESKDETEKKEEIEEQKIVKKKVENMVWKPLLIVLGVGVLCVGTIYSIYVVKGKDNKNGRVSGD